MSLESKILEAYVRHTNKYGAKDTEYGAMAGRIIKTGSGNLADKIKKINSLKTTELPQENQDKFDSSMFSDTGSGNLRYEQDMLNLELTNAKASGDYLLKDLHTSYRAFFKEFTKGVEADKRDEAVLKALNLNDGDLAGSFFVWLESDWDNVQNTIDTFINNSLSNSKSTISNTDDDEADDDYKLYVFFGSAKLQLKTNSIGKAKELYDELKAKNPDINIKINTTNSNKKTKAHNGTKQKSK